MRRALVIHPDDDVAVVLEDVPAGDEVVARGSGPERRLTARQAIPFGFKVALRSLAPGDAVRKYGHPIGRASSAIAAGDLVHIHNLGGARGRGDLAREGAR